MGIGIGTLVVPLVSLSTFWNPVVLSAVACGEFELKNSQLKLQNTGSFL